MALYGIDLTHTRTN